MKIMIFTTGGTIDKIYFDQLSDYKVGNPNIGQMLEELRVNFDYQVESLLKKDNLDMTEQDRELIYQNAENCNQNKILITHGTDTMIETAKKLHGIQNKTIVLTGALAPAIFKSSDAIFNVGCAISAVQIMEPGVYIAMSGRIYNPFKICKDREAGIFRELENQETHVG